ncbi:putative DNA endonuclease SmrA [Burkholderiales bacterium]|nr:putative DNA endonuclease SmrA [Burkholderiales bacterium]
MAKLADLKALLDAKRAAEPPAPTAHAAPAKGAAPRPPALAPRRAIAASKHAEGDVDLKAAFADVAPIKRANRASVALPAPVPVPRHRIADERDALEASKYGDEPAPQTWDIGQEIEGEQTFLRSGLGPDVLTRLRRGHWSVQAEVDLHGHDSEQARDALADFLVAARAAGLRCVRVIHGKGLTSPNREPVLKGKVRRWLAHWDDVLAYCEAPRHAGGGGAVVVLLRGR